MRMTQEQLAESLDFAVMTIQFIKEEKRFCGWIEDIDGPPLYRGLPAS
jgi:hypothetical protein